MKVWRRHSRFGLSRATSLRGWPSAEFKVMQVRLGRSRGVPVAGVNQ